MLISSRFRTTAPNISVDLSEDRILMQNTAKKSIAVYVKTSPILCPGKAYNSHMIRHTIYAANNQLDAQTIEFVGEIFTRLSLALYRRSMSYIHSTPVYANTQMSIFSEVGCIGKCSSSFPESDLFNHSCASWSAKFIAIMLIDNTKHIISNAAV